MNFIYIYIYICIKMNTGRNYFILIEFIGVTLVNQII